jgi:hypothetical protein
MTQQELSSSQRLMKLVSEYGSLRYQSGRYDAITTTKVENAWQRRTSCPGCPKPQLCDDEGRCLNDTRVNTGGDDHAA